MAVSSSYQRWYERNRPHLAAKQARYRKRHPERCKATAQRARDRRKDKTRVANRKWHLKTMYGLTLEQYEAMLIAQHGVCAVCRQPETALRRGTVKSLDVDHNHTTNQIRGLLCSACNNSLGMLREDPLRIRALAEYIERHNAK